MNNTPKITLVGAGPGDTDLISLKGLKALRQANVILYDALVNEELLDYASPGALRILVGKRAGQHSYRQQDINELLVTYAQSHGHVVRLKGGDPFVFGRGGEEVAHAAAHGIAVTVVPGISSAIGVAGLQGIPVTHRGVSESFWVIAGSTSSGALSQDIRQAARTNATVVVLMGLAKLAEIVSIFRDEGKAHLPVAVIQNGSLPDEKIALGTIATIVDQVQREGIGAPAVIVMGEVVAQHRQFEAMGVNALAV